MSGFLPRRWWPTRSAPMERQLLRFALLQRIGGLGLMRVLTLLALLAQNVVVVRHLSLDDIGRYYLFLTIAYLGNAAVFVGSDLAMQRKLADIASTRALNVPGWFAYLARTGSVGASLLFVASAAYFTWTEAPAVPFAAICCVLSLATYAASSTRSIVLLCDKPYASASLQLVEAVGKLASIAVLTALSGSWATPEHVALVTAAGPLLAAAIGVAVLLRITQPGTASYREPPQQLARQLATVGSSGLLNWVQLQGWRPLLAARDAALATVGAVSLLTTLGSTAGAAVFAVIGQLHVPKQYASGGGTSLRYVAHLLCGAVVAAAAALPFGYVFLMLAGKLELQPYLYLIGVGVFVEAGNALIGAAINHCNVRGQPMWRLPLAGIAGVATTAAVLVLGLPTSAGLHLQIAIGLAAGQLVTAGAFCWLTLRRAS